MWPSDWSRRRGPEILIGTATYPLVKDAGTFGPRYRFSVKGKREPVDRSASRTSTRPQPATPDERTRRSSAVSASSRSSVPAWSRRSSSGAGDWSSCSGLRVSASHGSCGRRPPNWAATHRSPWVGASYGTGITFWPLVEIVEELGGVDALTGLLADADDGSTIVEHIRAATGTGGDDGAPSDEVFWAVRRLFEHLAESRPLVVCVDDVHWAEPTMLDLIEYLLTFATGPIALVCAARSGVLEARTGLTGAWTIELEQLTDSETDVLVAALGVEDAALRAQIAATADGNPLFAEQLAAAVVERPRVRLHSPASSCRRRSTPSWRRGSTGWARSAGHSSARPSSGGSSRSARWRISRPAPIARQSRARSSRWRARD